MKHQIQEFLKKEYPDTDSDVFYPPEGFGDYSTNIVFLLAKEQKRNPQEIAQEIIEKLKSKFKKEFEKIEVATGGFINFYLGRDFLIKELKKISGDKKYGFNETMRGKTVMVEYTDPNPFKLFHIGHLMSNIIGETIARLYEASGAKVIRVNYQGDVGLHVAKAILGWEILRNKNINPGPTLSEKMTFLGRCYALGSAGADTPLVWKEFNEKIGFMDSFIKERNKKVEEGRLDYINKVIYDKSDEGINEMYEQGKRWSLDYFKTIYKKLGTKFDDYFYESEAASNGLDIVKKHPDIFTESDGALVFNGEKYGLHTRVFISSKGLPTYEAKELGVNKNKFEKYSPDLSLIITGNEINAYFKVLLKVMELVMPDVAARTRHIGHGMMRLPSGKMSSRTGDVVTADSLIEQVKTKLPGSDVETKEKIAIGAIKYFVLKQSPGHDIIFDFEKSVSIKGDAAPYLQYTYARLASIERKASKAGEFSFESLDKEIEFFLAKKLVRFPEVVIEASENNLPNMLALYLYELANLTNSFYESAPVLSEGNEKIRNARLALVNLTSSVLEKGLNILGIEAPERI